MSKQESAVAVWDFTIPSDRTTADNIKDICRQHCKKWTFQSEKGASGYNHFQGRVSLKEKLRLPGIVKLFEGTGAHFSITCNANRDNMFYVSKSETRTDGPWSDKDRQIYIPRQFRGILDNLRPWQKHIWDRLEEFEARSINIVYDPVGNQGKSTLAALIDLHGMGIDMPPCNDGEKLIQSLCNILMKREIREPKSLFIDLPRSMDQTKLYGMFTAIEQIKKGKVYDFRYSYDEWWFDSPQIWVFCNEEPQQGYVSRDRWKFWRITEQAELLSYTPA